MSESNGADACKHLYRYFVETICIGNCNCNCKCIGSGIDRQPTVDGDSELAESKRIVILMGYEFKVAHSLWIETV